MTLLTKSTAFVCKSRTKKKNGRFTFTVFDSDGALVGMPMTAVEAAASVPFSSTRTKVVKDRLELHGLRRHGGEVRAVRERIDHPQRLQLDGEVYDRAVHREFRQRDLQVELWARLQAIHEVPREPLLDRGELPWQRQDDDHRRRLSRVRDLDRLPRRTIGVAQKVRGVRGHRVDLYRRPVGAREGRGDRRLRVERDGPGRVQVDRVDQNEARHRVDRVDGQELRDLLVRASGHPGVDGDARWLWSAGEVGDLEAGAVVDGERVEKRAPERHRAVAPERHGHLQAQTLAHFGLT